ncbi:MAG: DUF5060 domain-containing protein [Polyangiaceae bacterium]
MPFGHSCGVQLAYFEPTRCRRGERHGGAPGAGGASGGAGFGGAGSRSAGASRGGADPGSGGTSGGTNGGGTNGGANAGGSSGGAVSGGTSGNGSGGSSSGGVGAGGSLAGAGFGGASGGANSGERLARLRAAASAAKPSGSIARSRSRSATPRPTRTSSVASRYARSYTAPSGKKLDFAGFFDGDGNGAGNLTTGNVWKLRFLPDELGSWHYTWTWSDGTAGGQGDFTVVSAGAGKGVLRAYKDNPRWFAYNASAPVWIKLYYELSHRGIAQRARLDGAERLPAADRPRLQSPPSRLALPALLLGRVLHRRPRAEPRHAHHLRRG